MIKTNNITLEIMKTKTYNEKEIGRVRAKTYSAVVNGTPTHIKAFLKENAVKRYKEMDSEITESDVNVYPGIGSSHQSPVDREEQIGRDEFVFVYGDK